MYDEGSKELINRFFIAILGLSAIAFSQPPGHGRNFAGQDMFRGQFQAKVVTGEPYSGVGVTALQRTLSDGNAINESSCVKVYRDSAGRTRREETRNSSTCSATPQTILISDPVAGVEYVINQKDNSYRQFPLKTPRAGGVPPAGNRPANPNQVQTSLGTQPIAGTSLSAQGTQTVTTIPAGQFGNAQPITITSVRWYSPDLEVVTQSSRNDPRNGVSTYQLSNVSTAEPAASLFTLPAGLTLEQGPSHGPNGRDRRAP
jgi:hypothetical protein